jgi:glycosyltransferase involved in cell wall biosynthesis
VKKLRLLLVAPRYWPLVAGPHTALVHLAGELRRRGHALSVLTCRWQPEWTAEVQHEGTSIVRLPPPKAGAWGTLSHVRSIGRWVRRRSEAFDAVYVCGLRHEAYAVVRAACARGPAVLLRAERAGPDGDCFWQLDARCGRRIKRACQAAKAFAAPSRGIERELIAAGYARDRIQYLPGGVKLPEPRTLVRQAVARASLGRAHPGLTVADGTPLAVWTGRLERWAGLTDLVRAWSIVVRQRTGARLWLVGDGPLAAEVAALVRELRLEASVVLAGAFDQVDEHLHAADVYLGPATDEGPCTSLLEALAAGLPVAATGIPGHRGFIEHQQQGLLVPHEDPQALASAALQLLAEPALARQLGEAARARVAREFTVELMADRHEALFATAIQRRAKMNTQRDST